MGERLPKKKDKLTHREYFRAKLRRLESEEQPTTTPAAPVSAYERGRQFLSAAEKRYYEERAAEGMWFVRLAPDSKIPVKGTSGDNPWGLEITATRDPVHAVREWLYKGENVGCRYTAPTDGFIIDNDLHDDKNPAMRAALKRIGMEGEYVETPTGGQHYPFGKWAPDYVLKAQYRGLVDHTNEETGETDKGKYWVMPGSRYNGTRYTLRAGRLGEEKTLQARTALRAALTERKGTPPAPAPVLAQRPVTPPAPQEAAAVETTDTEDLFAPMPHGTHRNEEYVRRAGVLARRMRRQGKSRTEFQHERNRLFTCVTTDQTCLLYTSPSPRD